MRYIKKYLERYGEDNQEISVLLGKTLKNVVLNGHADSDSILFTCEDGSEYLMYHSQDCSESVTIEDINGDLKDLIGSPITMAETVENHPILDKPKGSVYGDEDAWEWTFYKFATIKGYVDIRWYGCSNGYYSTAVDFVKVS